MTDPITTVVHEVDTPHGSGRLYLDLVADPAVTLVLGHGAGGGVDAVDLVALAQGLPRLGVSVVRYEQPWRTAGKKVAVAPPRLDEAWLPAIELLRESGAVPARLVLGGRSAGARVACRTADALCADAIVCLAFPLHPPGRPEKSRAQELAAPRVPRLVLQGTRDAFGGPAEVRAALAADPGVLVVDLPGADHGCRVAAAGPLTRAALLDLVVLQTAAFLKRSVVDLPAADAVERSPAGEDLRIGGE